MNAFMQLKACIELEMVANMKTNGERRKVNIYGRTTMEITMA